MGDESLGEKNKAMSSLHLLPNSLPWNPRPQEKTHKTDTKKRGKPKMDKKKSWIHTHTKHILHCHVRMQMEGLGGC